MKLAGRVLSIVALAVLTSPVQAEDDFPIVGTYTENQACKPDGSDPGTTINAPTVEAMKRIKRALDPLGIPNPGKMFMGAGG